MINHNNDHNDHNDHNNTIDHNNRHNNNQNIHRFSYYLVMITDRIGYWSTEEEK